MTLQQWQDAFLESYPADIKDISRLVVSVKIYGSVMSYVLKDDGLSAFFASGSFGGNPSAEMFSATILAGKSIYRWSHGVWKEI